MTHITRIKPAGKTPRRRARFLAHRLIGISPALVRILGLCCAHCAYTAALALRCANRLAGREGRLPRALSSLQATARYAAVA